MMRICSSDRNNVSLLWLFAIIYAFIISGFSETFADDSSRLELNPATFLADAGPAEPITHRVAVKDAESIAESALPISLDISYYLYSDYIFRFVNFSEYGGEAREKPNHQMTTSLGLDLGDFGSVSFDTFFEWYAAQEKINGEGHNLQEVDYAVSWSYMIEQLKTELSLGVTWYAFPNDKAINTFEYNICLAHNDAWMWKWLFPDNEDGVLNPVFSFAHDVDEIGGVWMELGISHSFEVADNLTLTPGYMVAVDGCYLRDDTFRFAGDQWSLVAGYDLGSLLQLPEQAGSLTVTGELYFNNAWGNAEDDETIQDEFWGGMSVNWCWGG